MASLSQVNIDIRFSGLEDLDQATKKMRQVQSEVKRLAQEERAGAISTDQYSKRVGQLASELQSATRGKIQARNEVNKYSREIRQAVAAQAQMADTSAIERRDAKERQVLQQYLRYQREKETAAQREARAQEQAAAQVERAIARRDAEERRAYQQYLRYQREKEVAAQRSARIQEQAAVAQRRLTAEMDQLRARFNPLAAASQRYEQELNQLNRAHQMGVINARQYDTALEQLNLQLAQGVTGMGGLGNAAGNTAQRMSRSSVITQQAGYQIGDFIVQVQSGTNAFVAFGQQATQVAGTLTILGGKWVLIGSVLGVAIPLFTAVAAAMMRTRGAARDAADGITTLAQRVQSARQQIAEMTFEVEALRRGFQDFREFALIQAVEEAQSRIAELQQQIYELQQLGTVTGPNERALEAAQEALRLAEEQLETYRQTREEHETLTNAEERRLQFMQDSAEMADRLRTAYEAIVNVAREAGDAFKEGLIEDAEALAQKVSEAAEELQRAAIEARDLKIEMNEAKREAEILAAETAKVGDEAERVQRIISLLSGANMGGLVQQINNVAGALGIAASEAARLVGGVRALAVFQAQGGSGRGGDPRQFMPGPEGLFVPTPEIVAQADALVESWNRVSTAASGAGSAGAAAAEEMADALEGANRIFADAVITAEEFEEAMANNVVNAVGDVADAWSDFVMRGFSDFKGFVQSVWDSFKNLIGQMIAMAARNRILIGLGLAPAAAAGPAMGGIGGLLGGGGGGGGGLLSGLIGNFGGGGSILGFGGLGGGSGLLGGLGNALSGGLGNIFNIGANAAAAGGGFLATIGSAIPVLSAVAVAFSFFRTKTKQLDSGLRITIDNMDALVESFNTVQKSRFLGLSKKISTTFSQVADDIADPIEQAVQDIQMSIMDAASVFGIANDAFDNFFYQLQVSLAGLDEDARMAKVTEELTKMGDAFTALTGHFETMNELLEAAAQRMELQNRLDQLLGNNEAILARQREAELAAMHQLNRAMLERIHILEDAIAAEQMAAQAVADASIAYTNALGEVRNAMNAQMAEVVAAVTAAEDDLRRAIEAEVTTINSSFDRIFENLNAGLESASQKAEQSRSIFELLDRALRDRRLSSESTEFASRQSAVRYISSGGMDEQKLSDAVSILNEPSEKFFGTFQDYARDFARTSNVIEQSRNAAEATMNADERAVLRLEEQIEQAERSRELQISQIEGIVAVEESVLSVTDAVNALREATADRDLIVQQHEELIAQFPDLQVAVLSISDAVNNLAGAQRALASAQADLLAAREARARAAEAAQNAMIAELREPDPVTPAAPAGRTPPPGGAFFDPGYAAWIANEIAEGRFVPGVGWVSEQNGQTPPAFAMGGSHSGGLRMVGEQGPELEVTGPSRIYSNRQTAQMFRDPELKEELRELRREVAGLRRESAELMVSNNKYVKRSYEVYRKWDIDGTPAERT